MSIVTDLDQYRCQPEKQVYCPHMDQAHTLLAEWLKAWDAGSDNAVSLYERTRALLKGKTAGVSQHRERAACNCIEEANKALAEHNTAIATVMTVHTTSMDIGTRITVPTRKVNSKGKRAMTLFATYCPLCGEKIEEPQS